ncbi:hypothetical protein EV363DRAFT_1295580 [Boletus edulis]|nr:hypothetical protein EV363DRAFT_1295580 [Boletus edulis]
MPRVRPIRVLAHHACGHCGQASPTLSVGAVLETESKDDKENRYKWEDLDGPMDSNLDREILEDENEFASRLDEGLLHENKPGDVREDKETGHGDLDEPGDRDGEETRLFSHYAMEFDEHSVAEVLGTRKTSFQVMKVIQNASGQGMYSPFADKGELELSK